MLVEINLISIVPKSERAQQMHEQYKMDIEGHINDFKALPLNIIVWGPGEAYDAAQGKLKLIRNKRLEMLNALRQDGHNANFSEELREEIKSLKELGNLKIEELIQAQCADMVCLLWGGSGSIGEAHDFGNLKEIAPKIILFVEKIERETYADGMIEQFLTLGGHLERFDENDLTACKVVGKAVGWALRFRKNKYLCQAGGVSN